MASKSERKLSFCSLVAFLTSYQDNVILLEEKPWRCTGEMLPNEIPTFTRAHCCCPLLDTKLLNLPLPRQQTPPKGNKISLWLFHKWAQWPIIDLGRQIRLAGRQNNRKNPGNKAPGQTKPWNTALCFDRKTYFMSYKLGLNGAKAGWPWWLITMVACKKAGLTTQRIPPYNC